MKLYITMVQRRDSYPGQHPLEALGCASEYDQDENQLFLAEGLADHRSDSSFESAEMVCFEVSEKEIMKRLRPELGSIKAVMVKEQV